MGSSKRHKEKDREYRKRRKRSHSKSKERDSRHNDRDYDRKSEKSLKPAKYTRRSPNYDDDYDRRPPSKYKYKDRSHDDSNQIEIVKEYKPPKYSQKSSDSEDDGSPKHSAPKYKHRDSSLPGIEVVDPSDAGPRLKASSNDQNSSRYEDEEIPVHASHSSVFGNVSRQSIGETNKMRLKLGLKPLDVTPSDEVSAATDGKQEVFVKTENILTKKKIEALREKLQAQREKRRLQQKFKKVKGLAGSDSDDDALSWVDKNRKREKEKIIAAERAKALEEMDEEFGIGNLMDEEFGRTKSNLYTSKNLSGMNVGHSKTVFKEGPSVILTLKDKDVLAEDEEVLQNVNLVEDEHATKNIQNKKKLGGYKPYDEPEYDEYGELISKDILDKYDEEISGPKTENFRLGSGGKINLQREAAIKNIKSRLQKNRTETLSLPDPVLASEFYTEADMVKFKKTKRKVRKVRKKILRADDLEPLPESANDHGSRTKGKSEEFEKFKQSWESGMSNSNVSERGEFTGVQPILQMNVIKEEEDVSRIIIEEDQAEMDLQQALNKARKLKQLANQTTGIEKIAEAVQVGTQEKTSGNLEGNSIVMNETAEFCRVLGDIPTYGQSGNREDEEDMMDMEEDGEKPEDGESEVPRGAWNEVEIDDQPVNIETPDEGPILEQEPVVGLGIAGALQLATQKGYLDKEMKKATMSAKKANLQAANYTIEDKNYDDEKVSNRRTDRFITGPINEFKEKASYRPDIKLDYIDDSGRILSQKEAFRYLSHKFHGKGPGKIKTEKRVKKQEEDVLLRQMSSTDTPLKTLSMLQDKQKETQSPFVVLSGGSKALQSNSLSKTK